VEPAAEYGLAVRVWSEPARRTMRRRGLPAVDNDFLDGFSLDVVGKAARYRRLLHDLPAGLNEWAVHPGLDGHGSPGADDDRLVRRTDHEFLISPQAHEAVRQEGIVVIDYRTIQQAWTRTAGTS
jgi:hypothetical protein